MSRRTFVRSAAGAMMAAAAVHTGSRTGRAAAEPAAPAPLPAPVRAITRGPKFHWFGYYDKLQFDPTGRLVLAMEVDFEGRSPTAADTIRIGIIDTADGDRWREIGTSSAWGWQQGCMLQWRPGSASQVLWNDREGDRFVCRVLDAGTGDRRTINHPVYALSPDGRTAVTPDFRRIQDMRPGYGYAGLPDPDAGEMRPRNSGIWRVDMETGDARLILSVADAAAFGTQHPTMDGAKHYFNHLLFSTDGGRFIFLHRWRPDGGKGNFQTRMLTASPDGKDLCVVDPSGDTSHFIWRDAEHILAWTRPAGKPWGFYLFRDRTEHVEAVGEGVMTVNGHCTYLPGNAWILNDTYPQGKERLQHLFLYHAATRRKAPLGAFHLPPAYKGEWRCDLHPRSSPDGRTVSIDSPHAGDGRQVYLLDASGIVGTGA